MILLPTTWWLRGNGKNYNCCLQFLLGMIPTSIKRRLDEPLWFKFVLASTMLLIQSRKWFSQKMKLPTNLRMQVYYNARGGDPQQQR